MIYEPLAGERIEDCLTIMVDMAALYHQVTATFNGTALIAKRGDDPKQLCAAVLELWRIRSEAYRASDEYKREQKRAARARRQRELTLQRALLVCPETISLSDPEAFERYKASSQNDPYRAGIFRYANWWARLLEGRLSAGGTIRDSARESSEIADIEGMSGHSYHCAVVLLSECWLYGGGLRRWHNRVTWFRLHMGGRTNAKPERT